MIISFLTCVLFSMLVFQCITFIISEWDAHREGDKAIVAGITFLGMLFLVIVAVQTLSRGEILATDELWQAVHIFTAGLFNLVVAQLKGRPAWRTSSKQSPTS